MDISVNYEDVKAKETFKVSIDLTSFESGEAISDADVTITFNGKTETGGSASFNAPKKEGEYELEVDVDKDGYHDITAKYIVPVEDFEDEDSPWPILGFMVVIVAIIAIIFVGKRKKTK
jgi:hypothetical protein